MVSLQERPSVAKISNLEQKFAYELCGIYDAEHRFLEAQQIVLECTQNSQLRSLLETHIDQTRQQIQNLEQVFSAMKQQPKRVTCDAAAGLISDGQKLSLLTSEAPPIMELALAGQQAKVEQYEITCYRALVKGAEEMGQNQAVQLLQQNLQQEEETARKIEDCMPQMLQTAKGGKSSRK